VLVKAQFVRDVGVRLDVGLLDLNVHGLRLESLWGRGKALLLLVELLLGQGTFEFGLARRAGHSHDFLHHVPLTFEVFQH